MKSPKKIAVGAEAIVEYIPEGVAIDAYFSFGEYDEEAEADTFGVPDHKIFYYCGPLWKIDMDALKIQSSDFKVIKYKVKYKELAHGAI